MSKTTTSTNQSSWPDFGQKYVISKEFFGPQRRRLFGKTFPDDRRLYSQAHKTIYIYIYIPVLGR